MLIRNTDWKATDYLSLSTQTSPTLEAVQGSMLYKAIAWAPEAARSCTISEPEHTDYYHTPTGDVVTGYASFQVHYYTSLSEGNTVLPEKDKREEKLREMRRGPQ